MFDLFGSGMPLAARFFIAFLVVLALIGATAWLVRRFGASRLGGAAARGRQPRLAVIDAATVDGRRRLVLIRRDNIEHLLMIGGPTDVVIEPNIVRAAAARDLTREPQRAGTGPDVAGRQAPTVDSGWPLQPLTEPPPVAPARHYRAAATEEPWLAPEPGARPRPPESLGGLTPDLSTRLAQPDFAPPPPQRSEPRVVAAPVPPPEPTISAQAQADHNLAEMALQLEAALRRSPMPEGRPPVTDPLAAQVAAPPPAPKPVEPPRAPVREFTPRVEPRFESKPEAKPEPTIEPKLEAKPDVKPEPKPAKTKAEIKAEARAEPKSELKPEPKPVPEKSLYDNLEEEMASLLGRPSGKS